MEALICLITFFACILGTICGMGGGIIIKPVMDAGGMMSVATINFLSGCTVIGMTGFTIIKTLLSGESVIQLKQGTFLAVGAAIGGLLGKYLFQLTAACFPDPNTAGGVQAAVLFLATLATLIYTVNKDRLPSRKVESLAFSFLIGFILGVFGAFLGIGGGPFNVAVLYYFFSMPTKTATQNSLYIILFSQAASTAASAGQAESVPILLLICMIIIGIIGSEVGRRINRKLSEKQATVLFMFSMILIMGINIYNIYQFFL